MGSIIGYVLDGQDNDTYMYEPDEMPSKLKCSKCGFRLNWFAHNPEYRLGRTKRDLTATYDGQLIVSKRFKQLCIKERVPGISFVAFDRDDNHFQINCERVVKFDAKRRKTRFENRCSRCNNYESIIGATPAYLLLDRKLGPGFFRTDICFASENEKCPLIIVGEKTRQMLISSKMNGLCFSPVLGK